MVRNKEIERSSDLATFCLHESHLDFDSRLLSQSRLTEHQPGGRVCVSIPREQGRRRDRCKICFQSSSPWVKLCLLELPAQEQHLCAAPGHAHGPSLWSWVSLHRHPLVPTVGCWARQVPWVLSFPGTCLQQDLEAGTGAAAIKPKDSEAPAL